MELLFWPAALTPFGGHAARVALVTKVGTDPVLILHENNENKGEMIKQLHERYKQLDLK